MCNEQETNMRTNQIPLCNLLLSATQTHHFHTSHAQLISIEWKLTAPLTHGEMKKILKPASVPLNHFSITVTKWQRNCTWTLYRLLKIWGRVSTQEGIYLQKYGVKMYPGIAGILSFSFAENVEYINGLRYCLCFSCLNSLKIITDCHENWYVCHRTILSLTLIAFLWSSITTPLIHEREHKYQLNWDPDTNHWKSATSVTRFFFVECQTIRS